MPAPRANLAPVPSSAQGRSLRRRGQRTQHRLLDAGLSVLAEHGYHAARVDDVVRVAEVSHGTFYLYFANKEDLFRSLAVRCAEDMASLAASLGPVDPGPAGRATLRSWLADFFAVHRGYGVVIRSWIENQVTDRELTRLGARAFGKITKALVFRIDEARPGHRHEAELRAAALLAMIERFAYVVVSRGLELDDAALDTIATVVHRGFFAADPPVVDQPAAVSRLRFGRR